MPQIILPVWYDTYGNATCAEYLKIGLFANKSCAPHVSAEEFGDALYMVLDEDSRCGTEIRATARLFGERSRMNDGRETAASVIKKMAGSN